MEEIQLEEVEKSESDSEERQNQSASEVPDGERQPKTIWVYVSGAVCTPGVYELPEGSRLFEALERAGGMTEAADKGGGCFGNCGRSKYFRCTRRKWKDFSGKGEFKYCDKGRTYDTSRDR